MQAVFSPINREEHLQLIKLLKYLGSFKSEYPQKLLAARRATFIAQIDQRERTRSTNQLHPNNEFIQRPDK